MVITASRKAIVAIILLRHIAIIQIIDLLIRRAIIVVYVIVVVRVTSAVAPATLTSNNPTCRPQTEICQYILGQGFTVSGLTGHSKSSRNLPTCACPFPSRRRPCRLCSAFELSAQRRKVVLRVSLALPSGDQGEP